MAVIDSIKTASFAMDYFKFGQGKKALVILPGLSVQSVIGAAAVEGAYRPLTDDFTIYLFDRRKNLPPSYTIDEMANDTSEAIREAGLERVSLFGVSQGGMIAMKMAIDSPDLVENLVLGSTAARLTKAARQILGHWVELAKEKDARGLYLSFGEAIYPPDVFQKSRELLAEAAKTVTEEELERFVILAQQRKDFDITQDLKKISCPVLAIGDRSDRVLGAEGTETIGKYLSERPDFQLYMYDGFGHAVYDIAPDYKQRILNFLLHRKAEPEPPMPR